MKVIKKKKMPRGKPFQKGFDERRHLTGAPARGESQAEVYGKSMNMTPKDIVLLVGRDSDLGRSYAQMPDDVPMKILLALRNLAAEMFEPSSGRMTMIMDRTEGKVMDKLDLSNKDGTLRPEEMKPSELAARAAAILELLKNAK